MTTSLPAPLTRFIGRQRERTEVGRLLRGTRLLTLTGAGGVGKTRLALEVASASLRAGAFQGGVWLAELATLSDPALVVPAAADAVGLREQSGLPLLDQLVGHLAQRHGLLILDNCEHLADACASLAYAVLRACPHVRALATSREPLGVPGETVWRVPSLSLPWPGQATTASQALASEAVQLFADRAAQARPDFIVSDENAPAVARVCFSLDGIPLALELAAARLRVLSVEQMAARLDERFRLLNRGSRMALARHQTLRAAIDWSYDLLTPPERALFRRMAVFAGGWTLEAAEVVGSDDAGVVYREDVLELLGRLIDRSLVVADERHGEVRYRLTETLRLYAEERLREAGERDTCEDRALTWYLALAERGERALWGSGMAEWSRRLEVEHDNVRVSLRRTLERGHLPEGLRLGAALGRFWALHGHQSEGLQWLEDALGRAGEVPAHVRARALNAAAGLARDLGEYARAVVLFDACVAMLRTLSGARGLALALSSLAVAAQLAGEHERATSAIEESLALLKQAGDRPGVAGSLMTLGVIQRQRGTHAAAEAILRAALAAFRDLADLRGMAACLNNLGNVANAQGQLAQARGHYRQSLELLRRIGDRREVAASLLNLAIVERDDGALEQAARLAGESLSELLALGDRAAAAACVEVLAGIAGSEGHLERAARLYGAAHALAESAGARLPALDPSDHAARTTVLRSRLGADRYARAWQAGRSMELDEAVRLALGTPNAPGSEAGESGPRLTRREREVAALLARGLTNRQIAETLVITPGTAALHVEHLRDKLGCHTRAHVAAWAVAHGLAEPAWT